MDTRTPRRPTLGGTAGIDSDPGLNTVKVPSDPAKLSSTQASFRVRLAVPVDPLIDAPAGAAFGDPYRMQSYGTRPLVTPQVVVPSAEVSALAGIGVAAPRRKGRVTAVTWSGQAAPGDHAATQLLDAVRLNTVPAPAGVRGGGGGSGGFGGFGGFGGRGRFGELGADDTQPMQPYGQAVPRQSVSPDAHLTRAPEVWAPNGELTEVSSDGSRNAWHPRRRVDLGLVLLPLRVLLGSLSVYAGFSKLCDPVYFDGGDRGSMMRWLSSLHPWGVAEPLLHFAMAHPVGAGLGVAFTEIVVGVLTVLGLWQRFAAGAAMLLSAALLFTVSWRAVRVYDTPDLIFLAAWSPLLIAGAPFGSLDGRISLEAWRRYGAAAPAAVRRRVLRRGAVVTAVVVGLTLLTGSMLGAAVRTGRGQQPLKPPSDYGSPMWPGNGESPTPSTTPSPSPSHAPSTAPASPAPNKSGKAKSSPGATGGTSHAPSGSGGGTSGQSGGSGGATPHTTSPSGGSGSLIGGVLGSGPLVDLPTPAPGMERHPADATV